MLITMLGIAVIAGVHHGIAPSVTGAGTTSQTRSEATLAGTYLYANQGNGFTYAGSDVFDGNGNVTSMATVGGQGERSEVRTATGTYTVNADCTGIVTYPEGIEDQIFIAPDGSLLTYVSRTPGSFIAGFEFQSRQAVR